MLSYFRVSGPKRHLQKVGYQAFVSFLNQNRKNVQKANCIKEGEVWAQNYKMPTLVHLNSQNRKVWMVSTEYSCACKYCGCMLNTDHVWLSKSGNSEKIDVQNRKLILCGFKKATKTQTEEGIIYI